MFKLGQGLQIELNAWTDRKLRRVTAVSIVLGLEIHPDIGTQFEMRINFRQKLNVLSASRQTHETNKTCPSPKRLIAYPPRFPLQALCSFADTKQVSLIPHASGAVDGSGFTAPRETGSCNLSSSPGASLRLRQEPSAVH